MSSITRNITSPDVKSDIFWGEIAPCEHMLQIYEDEDAFVDTLEGFVAGGLKAGDGVIVIATTAHLAALENRLLTNGISADLMHNPDQFIALNVEETLPKFLVKGWPDEQRFEQLVTGLLQRARGNGRRVRAFGELVAVMWGQGLNGATIRLEHLWHKLCQREAFSLFCAYPRSGFTQDAETSIRDICQTHSRMVEAPCR